MVLFIFKIIKKKGVIKVKRFFKYFLIILLSLVILFTAFFFLFPGAVLKGSMKIKVWSTGLSTKQIKAGKHTWPYYEGGEKNKETIIFVHGYGANKFFWINELAHFQKKYHVISPDVPAFGDNEMVWELGYGIESQVEFLNEFIEALKLDKVHLIGISMGGLISGYYASTYPNKLKSLVLIDSGGITSPVATEFWTHYRKTGQNLIDYENVEGFDKMMEIVFLKPQKVPTVLKKYFVEEKKKRFKKESRVFTELMKKSDNMLAERLDKIKTPTLIVWGDQDKIFHPSTVQLLEKKIKDSKAVILSNAGHASIIDNQKDAYAAIEKFLSTIQ